ncbi:MAG TPA: exodeoxyribonuclease III [Actinomycetota bacterium]
MKIVTWNVNSIRQRLPRLLAMLDRVEPDVVCLQETKVEDALFPTLELSAAGYEHVTLGQRAYNGVAILSRVGLADLRAGFDADPVPEQSRVVAATAGGLRVVCVYVVNGKVVGDPAYETKLVWLDALVAWLAATNDPAAPLLLCGDFNVAPDDRDVWDAELWRGKNLASEPERERIRALEAWGLTDLGRTAAGDVQGPFTYWDYTAGAFHKGWGLRIDLALATGPVAARLETVEVDRNERRPTAGEGKPSDHAPLVVTLGD